MEKSDKEPVHSQSVAYAIKVNAELDDRISNHVRALKYLEGGYTKKRWVRSN